jgi:hypothetical protein
MQFNRAWEEAEPYARSAEEWRDAVIMHCAMWRIHPVSAKCAKTSIKCEHLHQADSK